MVVKLRHLLEASEYPVEAYERLFAQMPLFSKRGLELRSYIAKMSKLGYVYVLDDGDLKGLIGFYANDLKTHVAYLSSIVVDKSMRRSGVASNMIAEMENACRLAGMKAIRANVVRTNVAAIRFYDKQGFCIVGDGRDEYRYEIEKVIE